ncbi:MAG: hypothetical protein A4E19_01425 [Nitrospira sp. SG-bin1]|nr:MAG: hypothetical protein A4E19_01425 [Nitrospira sp. SG-bin1]
MLSVFITAGLVLSAVPTFAVQNETREEKAANLKKQAVGGLFKKWTFDQDQPKALPSGFIKGISTDAPLAEWVVQVHATAPSPPNVIAGVSNCARPCYQVLLADGLEYEYPDLSVRFHAQEGTAGRGGVVFGVHDARNFYAVIVDPIGQTAQLVRLLDGQELSLAQASINLKPVDWHSLRLQRNTIISKDFIEVFVDGVLVLSVEDQALGLGQIGLVILGTSTVLFDSFHAVPLFSHRPLSAPPAY